MHGRAVAGALSAMTFAIGRRFVIADGVERWKEADVAAVAAAMEGMDPEALTVAFFAREDGRVKAPAALHKAVEKAGGKVARRERPEGRVRCRRGWPSRRQSSASSSTSRPRGRSSPRSATASSGCCASSRSSRSSTGRARTSASRRSQASSASSAERKAWTLADALVAGDEKATVRLLVELRQQGERLPSLQYQMVRRVRDALAIAEALAAGKPAAQVRKTLRMPSFAADRLIADVSNRDVESYRRALELLADLEVESRGWRRGSAQRGHRRPCARCSRRAIAGCSRRALAQPRGARLLAGAVVAVQRAALDRLVDQLHEAAVLGVGGLVVTLGDGGLQAAEVGLDRGRVLTVLGALPQRALIPLDL